MRQMLGGTASENTRSGIRRNGVDTSEESDDEYRMSDALNEAMTVFRSKVETFLAETGMAVSRFGRLACGDGDFIADLRKGAREFRPSTIRKVEKFMSDYPEPSPAHENVNPAADPSERAA